MEHDNINWLPDEEYDKLIRQLRFQMLGIFAPFKHYGQDVFIPHAAEEATKL